MQGLATKGSRLGTKLRKRECVLREGPILRPNLPPEFSDPDLNEGWEEADGKRRPSNSSRDETGADKAAQSSGASPRHNFYGENITALMGTRACLATVLVWNVGNKESSKGPGIWTRGHKKRQRTIYFDISPRTR